jgi:hypothetical protein
MNKLLRVDERLGKWMKRGGVPLENIGTIKKEVHHLWKFLTGKYTK